MERPLGLLDLPGEILQKIFMQVPNELKQTCRTFVVMYNDHYMNLFVKRFGPHIMRTIANYDYNYLVDYIRSFDYWRKDIRNIIAKHYDLPLPSTDEDKADSGKLTDNEKLHCQYIRDSWKLVYGIYVNRRIFVDHDDYTVNSYANAPLVSVNIDKTLKLTPGLYNMSCGLIIKTYAGMSSSVFKVFDSKTGNKLLEFQPASHFSELVPHNKFVLLDIGSFEVKKPKIIEQVQNGEDAITEESEDEIDEEVSQNKLIDIRIVVEEAGVMVKSGYILCYIDINAYQTKDCMVDSNGDLYCINDKYWLAWWIENQSPKPENVVNILLKRLYKSIEKSMKLITVTSPHRRMGSFAEADFEASIKGAEMTKMEEQDKEDSAASEPDLVDNKIELDTYNKNFYSKYNEWGELIIREFKFRTMKDRQRYEEWLRKKEEKVRHSSPSSTSYPSPSAMEPLKWKLTTLMEL